VRLGWPETCTYSARAHSHNYMISKILMCAFVTMASAGVARLFTSDQCRLRGQLDQFGHGVFTCPEVNCDDGTPCKLFIEDNTNADTDFGSIRYSCTCNLETSPANACLAVGTITFNEQGRFEDFECIHPDWCEPLPNGETPLSCIRTEVEDWGLEPAGLCKC
jgi:hypothetical protein